MAFKDAETRRAYEARPDVKARRRVSHALNRDRLCTERNARRAADLPHARALNRKANAKRQAANRAIIAAAKDRPCMDCDKRYPPYVMDFDHRPGEVKVLAVAKMLTHSADAVRAEIVKCDVVCANCHRERTHKRKLEN